MTDMTISVPLRDVSVMKGATCTASSEHSDDYPCENALTSGYEWLSSGQDTGVWINVQLTQAYYLTKVMVRGRCNLSQQAKAVQMTFDEGSTQTVFIMYFN